MVLLAHDTVGARTMTDVAMPSVRAVLLAVLVVLATVFAWAWLRAWRAMPAHERHWPSALHIGIGLIVAFFDTLGIGSMATTTTLYKTFKVVPDERLPGTMLIGLSLPVVVQAFIFVSAIQIDTTLLVTMIAASLAGGWIGARVVTRLPRRPIQIGMGIALLMAACFMAAHQLGLMPGGGTALRLEPGPMAIALIANFVLNGLMMLGIGSYGPTLVLLSVLGMDPRAAFPIMMGSGAFAAMVGGFEFIKRGGFAQRPALGLTLGGIPAVLVAGLIVKSIPLDVLRWIVVVVVVYAASMLLRSRAEPNT